MKTKYLVLLAILGIGALLSCLGCLRNRGLMDNQGQTMAIITDVYDITGDRNVPKIKEPVESFKVTYDYEVMANYLLHGTL